MKSSVFAIILTMLSVFYGLCLLLIPVKFMSTYEVSLDATSIYFARLVGVSLVAFAILFWSNRKVPFSDRSWQSLLLATAVSQSVSAVINVKAILNGFGNSMSWTTVAVNALVVLSCLYFFFQKKTVKSAGLA